MNIKQAAHALFMSETTLTALVADGTIRVTYSQSGKRAAVNEADVAAYLAANPRGPREVDLPDTETLLAQFKSLGGYTQVGRLYGVAGKTIRRRIEAYLPPPAPAPTASLPDVATLLADYARLGTYRAVAAAYAVSTTAIRDRIGQFVPAKERKPSKAKASGAKVSQPKLTQPGPAPKRRLTMPEFVALLREAAGTDERHAPPVLEVGEVLALIERARAKAARRVAA